MPDSLPDQEGRILSVRASRLLTALLLGAVLALGAPAVALAQAQPPATTAPTTAPSIDPLAPATEADKDKTRNKLIVGVAAVLLLGLVIYGNRVRAKRKK